jgi:HNH endonuclease
MRSCEFPDCGRPHKAKGLCSAHYYQHLRTGSTWPIGSRQGAKGEGTIGPKGYRRVYAPGHPMTRRRDGYVREHRKVAWDHGILQAPKLHLEVHHRDGDRLNNDPANLAALTADEHLLAHGGTPGFCPQGHDRSVVGVYRRPGSDWSECRQCRRDRKAAYRRRKKAALKNPPE